MEMFNEIDVDGSGALDQDELRNFGTTLGFDWDNTFAQVFLFFSCLFFFAQVCQYLCPDTVIVHYVLHSKYSI
jgi:hypothetical protein